jgi:hypothetical protein
MGLSREGGFVKYYTTGLVPQTSEVSGKMFGGEAVGIEGLGRAGGGGRLRKFGFFDDLLTAVR